MSETELSGLSQIAGLGVLTDVAGKPDVGGVMVTLTAGIRLDIDAGERFVPALGEGGLGRGSSRCSQIADD